MISLSRPLVAIGRLAADEAGRRRPRTPLLGFLLAVLALTVSAAGCDGDPHFATISPGSQLPSSAICGEQVDTIDRPETHPGNVERNTTTGGPTVDIDGADERWNTELAPRVVGDYAGTTEQILLWGSCKWGFDENITRARAVTESSWSMDTAGDVTEDPELCALIALEAPCAQSHGLLQVKGTVHEGTYPRSTESTAFGVDYAMAWLRACYEGSFTWLEAEGYEVGDEWGCVGAWFSGHWYDEGAERYIAEVRGHLTERTWEDYRAADG
ncbi:MAG: hypothetical protein AAGA93_26075 [Actinomycetota bacterium]